MRVSVLSSGRDKPIEGSVLRHRLELSGTGIYPRLMADLGGSIYWSVQDLAAKRLGEQCWNAGRVHGMIVVYNASIIIFIRR